MREEEAGELKEEYGRRRGSDEGGCTRDEDTGFKWNSIVD